MNTILFHVNFYRFSKKHINQLDSKSRAAIIACLFEGNSICTTSRMTGVSRKTVDKVLIELGGACFDYQDKVLRNLFCKRVQCDEIWSFVGAKEGNIPTEQKGNGRGDVTATRELAPKDQLRF